jgi:hypothetical protein
MMSSPDRVDVDHPGMQGAVLGSSSNAPTTVNGDGTAAAATVHAVPWKVGATEGYPGIEQQAAYYQHAVPFQIPEEVGVSLLDAAGMNPAMPPPSNVYQAGFAPRVASPPTALPGGPAIGMGGGATIGASGEATSLQRLSSTSGTSSSSKSFFQETLFQQPSPAAEAVLAASCDALGFDIAEMWLRTGPKTHQLTTSHLRPTALEDSVRNELIDVYYGERSSERTHRLSPALCKRAKEASDVVWVTAQTPSGAEALRNSISDVRTAVAIPVCHEPTNTNLTIIFFSIRR